MNLPVRQEAAQNAGPDADRALRRVWEVLWRGRWLIIGGVAVAMVAGITITLLQRPVYRSEATIQIEQDSRDVSLMGRLAPPGFSGLAGIGGSDIQTEIALLGSRRVAEPVVDSLALHVVLEEPRRERAGVLRVLAAPRDAVPGTAELVRERSGSYRVIRARGDTLTVPARVAPGAAFHLGSVQLLLAAERGTALPEELRISIVPFSNAVAALRKELVVLRPDPGAQVLSVRYESADPLLAAAVPNALARSFVRYRTATAQSRSASTAAFLRNQVASYQQRLADAEDELRRFRERAQIVAPEQQATEGVRRYAELQATRDELAAERELLGELFERVDAERGTGRDSAEYRRLASFPTFLANAAVQDVLRALNELESERSELLILRTPQSVDVQGVNGRILELQDQLYQLARNYFRNLGSQIGTLNASLARSETQLGQVPAREVELFRLMREQKLLEEAYSLLQTRLKEEEIRMMDQPQEVRVIDAALIPSVPASPRPLVNLAVAGLLGLLFGVAAAFLRDIMDTRVRTPEEAVAAALGIPVIGMIPHQLAYAGASARNKFLPAPIRRWRGGQGPALLPALSPSPGAEAYRGVRTSLLAGRERHPRVIVITSAGAEDGKTTSAANLAVVFAQQSLNTLLVDADLRNGFVHQLFDMAPGPGLAAALENGASPSAEPAVLPAVPAGMLHLIPRGAHPRDPAALLGSERMRELLATWRDAYDIVVIDAPPVNAATDAAILGMLADATVLVTRPGTTHRHELRQAVIHLGQFGVAVRGLVLNGVEQRQAFYGPSEPVAP